MQKRTGVRAALTAAVLGVITLTGIAVAAEGTAKYKQVKVYLTSKGTADRLADKGGIRLGPMAQPEEANATVMLDASKTFQVIEGFGGAFTDAAAETYAKLPAEARKAVLTAYFDPKEGIGYTLCRTQINSCDFSSGSYAYDEVAGDTKLEHFSISHDLHFRIPLIKEALGVAGGNLRLFASPWSPPAWMKTNNDMLHGGKLRPECRQAWADYFVRFIQAYGEAGVQIWGVTVQNEPMAVQTWESCVYTAEEERDFVADYLGPTLERAGVAKVNIIIWDHNRGIMVQRAATVLEDPKASRYVWGTGFHWYVGDHFDNVRLVHDAFPDKKLLFTEGTPANFSRGRLEEWKWGEVYARSMIHDLNNWANGWVDWNLLVDERGGPNHVGNFCVAPITGDTRTGKLTFMNSYHYIGHFSRFIRPGAKRILCSSNSDDLLATAFVNPDGSVATVVMNELERPTNLSLWIDGAAARTAIPAHSIMTLVVTDKK